MKNSEKMDIKLSEKTSEKELSPEKMEKKNYETALRYINIAEHMKQPEERAKYYHRAIQHLKLANDTHHYDDMIEEMRRHKFQTRADGKISLYEEASYIRDHAKTPQDYFAAQTIFLRIYKYEQNHSIDKRWVTEESYQKTLQCLDSKEQADYCEKMALQILAKQRRKSLCISSVFILMIVAALLFTRTASIHTVRASLYNHLGDYRHEFQQYDALYKQHGVDSAYEKYQDARYRAGKKSLEENEFNEAYADFKALAKENYKDTQNIFFQLEQERLSQAELGEQVPYARMQWRVLEKQDDRILLLKDKAMKSVPFCTDTANANWTDSDARAWLNTEFLETKCFANEIDGILETEVVTGSASTKDKVFLLSAEEVEKYAEQICTTQSCWWLRTPGVNEGTQSFVLQNKTVMTYGYDATCEQFTLKPAIWVSLK